jgi:predicted nucleic acid-binding protein
VILVDSSVWIEHFRSSDPKLRALLEQGRAVAHPFVIGELALGHLRKRAEVLSLLRALPRAPQASHEEVLAFVEMHRLPGSGVGWIDAHLLASAKLSGGRLWTRDRALVSMAERLGLADV